MTDPGAAGQRLEELYLEDRAEHANVPPVGTPEYDALRERDRARRTEASELLAGLGGMEKASAEELYHAAWLFNHGDTPDEARRAHELARAAADAGHERAPWLAAAAYDRWCMYEGRPQKFGTQFVPDGTRFRLWDVEPGTTDEERAAHGVPTLEEQRRRAERMTREQPQPPMDLAPDWLREAIERWATGPRATRVSRIIDARPAEVYEAFLDPDLLTSWLPPDGMRGSVHELEPREGGRFRMSLTYEDPVAGPGGKTTEDTDTFHGRVAELVPGERVVQVVEFESDQPGMSGEMRVTWSLAEADGRTEVTVVCEDIPRGIRLEDNETGSASSLEKLARLVETRADPG